jgi:hypothetical protein
MAKPREAPLAKTVLAAMSVTSLLSFTFILYKSFNDIVDPTRRGPTPLTSATVAPVIRCTLGWLVLYYSLVCLKQYFGYAVQSAGRKKDKRTITGERLKIIVDRLSSLMAETAPPFLLALWLHAT